MPEGPARQAVQIVLIDQQGVRVAYQSMHSLGENLDTYVTGQGYTIVQVYIDGRLIKEIRP